MPSLFLPKINEPVQGPDLSSLTDEELQLFHDLSDSFMDDAVVSAPIDNKPKEDLQNLPKYTFKHVETNEQIELTMTIAMWEAFRLEHPEYVQVITGAPAIGTNDLGVTKPSDHFREKLRAIKKNYKGSNIETF